MDPRSENGADSSRLRTSLMFLPSIGRNGPGNDTRYRCFDQTRIERRGLFPVKSLQWILLAALFLTVPVAGRATAREIYPDPAQATPEIAAALKAAAQTHR